MIVFRITLKKWSEKLHASGNAARWNSKGKNVIYTASSRALACLENVVHRSGEGLNESFKVMIIELPDSVLTEEIYLKQLPKDWRSFEYYGDCQLIGDKWIDSNSSVILKIPSAIIANEFNYLLNINHPNFKQIKLIAMEDFLFDSRLKKN